MANHPLWEPLPKKHNQTDTIIIEKILEHIPPKDSDLFISRVNLLKIIEEVNPLLVSKCISIMKGRKLIQVTKCGRYSFYQQKI